MSWARLLEVARLELSSGLKGPLFWVLVASVGLLSASLNTTALIPSGDPTAGGALPYINSQHALAQGFALSGALLYSFFAALVAGLSIIRDDESMIADVLHSTPLTVREYVFGKFTGCLAILVIALVLHLVFAIYFFQWAPTDDTSLRGTFQLANFVVPALVFALPTIFFCAGLAYAVAAWTRKSLLIASVPLGFFFVNVTFLWQWTPSWLDPSSDRWLMLIDTSGLRWVQQSLFAVDRGVEYYNSSPIAFDAIFLWNRALVMVIPTLAIAATLAPNRRVIAGDATGLAELWRRIWKRQSSTRSGSTPDEQPSHRPVKDLEMRSTPPGFFESTLQVARAELRELRAQPGLYVFVPMIMATVWELASSSLAALDAPVIATAGGPGGQRVGAYHCGCLPASSLLPRSNRYIATGASGFRVLALRRAAAHWRSSARQSLAQAALVSTILLGWWIHRCAVSIPARDRRVELWPLLLVWGLIVPPTLIVWSCFVTAVYSLIRNRYAHLCRRTGGADRQRLSSHRDSMTWVANWNLWGNPALERPRGSSISMAVPCG